MTFNITELLKVSGVNPQIANIWGKPLSDAMVKYGITTPERIKAFIATILHESANITRLKENLNYSAKGLANTWPNRYAIGGNPRKGPNDLAYKLNRNPRLIANYTYANRMGNGGPETNEGFMYRGKGLIQLTGKNNCIAASKGTGIDFVSHPEYLVRPVEGSIAACWFWNNSGVNKYADRGDIDGVRDIINRGHKTAKIGDSVGYMDVVQRYSMLTAAISKNPNRFVV